MELALSLGGDTPKGFSFLEKQDKMCNKDLGFCMKLGRSSNEDHDQSREDEDFETTTKSNHGDEKRVSSNPPLQLDLLPFSPVPRNQTSLRFPWLHQNLGCESGTMMSGAAAKGVAVELNRRPPTVEEGDEGASLSSPNSVVSSFQMDFSIYNNRNITGKSEKRDFELMAANEADVDRCGSSRASDEEENGSAARKKLRLTKEQSAFLEDSFKEHTTLNPKQKLALARQLNLRPRQVEVWFQNRRARTKLKQTEVDCEYLKRCCEALTEENRRLQKELQELRALKTSQPFYMQLPATTLTMCPSCERTVTNSTSPAATTTTTATNTTLSLAKPKIFPYSAAQFPSPQAAS